jgi:hypothetical protein
MSNCEAALNIGAMESERGFLVVLMLFEMTV